MASLLDRIQQNLNTLNTQPAAQDNTLAARNMMAARSGKAVATPTSAVSSVGEQAAQDQTSQQLGQLQQAGQIQAAQLGQQSAQQTQEAGQQKRQLELKRKGQDQQFQMKSKEILADLQMNKESLSLDKDRAKLEQLSTVLALQDKKYVDQLQREGDRMRLNTEQGFKEALLQSTFGNNLSILKKQIGDQSILDMDDRSFKRAMGNMSINEALSMAKSDQKAAATGQMISSATAAGKAGVDYYSRDKPATETAKPTTDASQISTRTTGNIA